MSVVSQDRVGSSGFAIATSAVLWLVLPTGWPTLFWFIVFGVNVGDPGEGTALALVIVAVPAALLWWLWWRFAGVSARRLPDGLRVRGVWKTRHVSWDRLVGVDATESVGHGRAFWFSWTIVTFRPPGDDEVKSVKVSRSYQSGTVGRDTILGWLPPSHWLYRPMVAPPPSQVDDSLPALVTLRLPTSSRLIYTGVFVGLAAFLAWLATRYEAEVTGAGRAVVLAMLLAPALALLAMAVRVWFLRVVLTAQSLIDHGFFGKRGYPADAIQDVVVVPSGVGAIVRVVLVGRGSRQLAAGGGYGDYPAQMQRYLAAWLADR